MIYKKDNISKITPALTSSAPIATGQCTFMDIDVSAKQKVASTSAAPPIPAPRQLEWFYIHPLYMFDRWTEKYLKMMSTSEDLTVNVFQNSPSISRSLIKGKF